MTVALINTTDTRSEKGKFATEADARKWLDTVEKAIDPKAVAAGAYVIEPVELDGPHITISLEIENTYELYGDVTTHAESIVIPVPPSCERIVETPEGYIADGEFTSDRTTARSIISDGYDAAYEEWFQEHIVGWSGYGRPDGDSWYDFTVTASSDENLIAVGATYDWGY